MTKKAEKEKAKHAGGRPRTLAPSKEECIALGEEYIQWLNNNIDAVHHTEFYSIYKHILTKEWDAIRDCEEFRPYYEQARFILAKRHMTGAVKEGIAHRFLRLYLHDLKQAEDQNKEFEAKIKSQLNESDAANLIDLLHKLKTGEIAQK